MDQSKFSGSKLLPVSIGAIVLLALLPQILLWAGKSHGSYFVSNYDEPAYSAYVNSLINGRPRKNDPFLGRSDSPETPQPETLYSIQFVPAYLTALPARAFGISASTAFILLAIFIAAASTAALYKLLLEVTGDSVVSAVGPVVILCLGTAVAFQGELRYLIDGRVLTDFLPFLRRYQPGVTFPLFFIFCLLVWKAVRSAETRRTAFFAITAGLVFGVLVFSYFYLWTAAAAWLICFAVVSMILDRSNIRTVFTTAGIILAFSIAALVPYFYLLGQRSSELDNVQLLAFTRVPEIASPSMLIGLVVAAVAFYMLRTGEGRVSGGLALILSFALTPVILFNQQIVTGRSLQPVHYELFIANYMVLTAAVLLLSAWFSGSGSESGRRSYRGLAYLGIAAFAWGAFEAYGSSRRNMTPAEIRDASVPAIVEAVREASAPPVILATNFVTADFIPSVGNARPLWNPHSSSAGGIGIEENRRLFYLFLYFSGYTDRDLEAALKDNSFEVTAAIFGSERALPSLAGAAKKITSQEISAEVAKFGQMTRNLDAYSPVIDHIIVPTEAEPSFANLDRWYSRDEGKVFGLFKLYRLTPKHLGAPDQIITSWNSFGISSRSTEGS